MTVMFDLAEGSGEYSAQEKSRFYRMARRSATECASIFDIGQRIRIIEQQRYHRAAYRADAQRCLQVTLRLIVSTLCKCYLEGRELLIRIVSMLTKMVQGNTGAEIKIEEAIMRSTS